MGYETIIYEKDNGIATLTFNRPEVLNAANFQMADEVFGLVEEASKDDEVRVLIITGAGRGFHSGDDIKSIFLAPDREQRFRKMKMGQLMGTWREHYFNEFPKPTIAAISGPGRFIRYKRPIRAACQIRTGCGQDTSRGGPADACVIRVDYPGSTVSASLLIAGNNRVALERCWCNSSGC